jgi:hypothetical protein
LTAVNNTFLVALEHEELGHIATPQAMLAHLKEEYGELDATEIETNRATLAGAWNPDDHIEDLFTCIWDAQRLATKANEPITDSAAICLTITVLKNTGVFESALELWHLKPEADKTMDNFKKHFFPPNIKPAWPNSQPKLLDIMVPMHQVVFHPVSPELPHHLHHIQESTR